MTEPVTTGQKENKPDNMVESEQSTAEQRNFLGRKEKRKALKKDKRKQVRKELAAKARAEEEARLNDPEEQRKIQLEEERENERLERERKEFEERERIFLQELERKKKEEEEEEERMNAIERELKLKQEGGEEVLNEDDEWEYVEEGPPEIIWQGNEIIVKKNKVKVKKKEVNQDMEKEDSNRPTSNPLPPQSEAYAAYKSAPVTSAPLMDTVAQQVPNFGTEQDKSHCPFHIKTGACRFGSRCNRVHYYPDKSTTLLIKNMYNGPGLAWDQDEGLEYTEEVEHSYEEFYEDVHTEFMKFGEIINFKVCRNGSFHLRGNVYIQYKSMDSAVMAYNSVQGRYFAAKQVKCEFVSLTRWKVAICGEYMKSRLKTCSRGSACNFLHCFSNPGGDYEWADCDKPPPRYWVKKMTALFGYSDAYWHDKHIDEPTPKHSTRISTSDRDSYYDKKRQRSIETNRSSSRNHHQSRYGEDEKDEDTDSGHYRSRSRSRRDDYDRHRRTSDYSDEEDKTRVYPKRKSRHRKNDSESSSSDEKESNDAKVEAELQRHKQHKTKYHHGRSTSRHNRDEEEPFIKKQKTSRSRDTSYLLDKNDATDRWQPNTSPDEHISGKKRDRKPKDKSKVIIGREFDMV